MAFNLSVIQKVPLSVSFKDAAGNDAVVDTSNGVPVWASSDPAVCEIINVSADGMSCEASSVAIGNAQISVTADADMGAGIRNVVGVLDISVLAAEAVSAGISAGTPVLK